MAEDRQRLYPGKLFIDTALDALDTKTAMSRTLALRYLQRAAMAGMIASLFYLGNFGVIAGFTGLNDSGSWAPVGRMAGGVLFGLALVFIYYSRSELLTSNMMVASIGMYYRRTTFLKSGWMLTLCYLGNLLGCLLIAVLVANSSMISESTAVAMDAAVATKTGYLESGAGVLDLFIRAILCNLMINLAMIFVYNGAIKDDLTKSLTMITAVFLFAFLGLEHSVANTALFAIHGLNSGIDVLPALGNLGVALLGNLIGGGVLIGWYYAYANDDRRDDKSSRQ